MAFTNSVNATTAGIVGLSAAGVWTGTPVTQYNLLVGGATNQVLTNIAPSATSGVALISQGAAANPAYGTVVVAGGGTGLATLVAYELLAAGTSATGALQQIGLGSAGQVLTSNGAGALASFQAAGTPSAMAPYLNANTGAQAMAVNQGYIVTNATIVTFTPPATCAVGTIFAVAGSGAGGWTINLATNSQTMHFGTASGTTALASSNQYDSVQFVCTVANTTFTTISSVGNLTIS